MPIKSAAFKAVRQTQKRRARNLAILSTVKKAEKALRKALVSKDKSKATDALKAAIKVIDRAKQKGVLKPNTAGRKKSRLTAAVRRLG